MSTAAKYGDLDLGSVPHVTTVEEFLVALNISHLLPKFTARGVTTIEHLLHLLCEVLHLLLVARHLFLGEFYTVYSS